jgi:hypothetical protein
MERTVVGARELKTRLGTYLRRVGEGRVTLPLRKSMVAFRPIQSRGRALSDAVIEDRKDRF